MEYKDYYKILEIDKKATPDEIKRAYRKLAKKYHPDTNNDKDAEAKFKDATEAYEVLSDANKKAKYDNLGNSYNRFKTTGGNPNDFKWNDWYATYKTDNKVNSKNTASDFFNQGGSVSDFFERIFGNTTAKNTGNNKNKSKTTTNNNKSKQTTQTKGKNYQTEITLSMEEVYKGTKRVFNIDNQRIEVKFKQGITDGHTQKISGKGYPSQNGGKAGDLIIKVKIAEDIKVERKKNDIYTNVECDLYTAMLGGNVTFTTFFGSFNIKIPAETQNGKTFKLSNQGMPVYNSNDNEKGDLYVHLQVVLPTNLNPEEKQMFEKLKSIRN